MSEEELHCAQVTPPSRPPRRSIASAILLADWLSGPSKRGLATGCSWRKAAIEVKIDLISSRWLDVKLPHDGLEREFNFLNALESGICTMCTPRDQRKSSANQREQVELNASGVSGGRRAVSADVTDRVLIRRARTPLSVRHRPQPSMPRHESLPPVVLSA